MPRSTRTGASEYIARHATIKAERGISLMGIHDGQIDSSSFLIKTAAREFVEISMFMLLWVRLNIGQFRFGVHRFLLFANIIDGTSAKASVRLASREWPSMSDSVEAGLTLSLVRNFIQRLLLPIQLPLRAPLAVATVDRAVRG